jgi:UDP-N-acetylglucosamine--N-acetylmuramyl-(pentapeptide) pyrophosphoryl-undecaprenol N-acetylglucosamine transferase
MTRILFAGGGTGGHLYPALALGEAVQALRPGTEVHYVGARRGVEARVLPQREVPHTLLPFEPLRRDHIWQNWRLFPSLSSSFLGLSKLFLSFRPDVVVGTGGYASGPAGFLAYAAGIPVAVQEQNSYPGLTTRTLSRVARQVFLGFPEAADHLKPGRRTEIHTLGNPIAPPDTSLDRLACRARYGVGEDSVVVLVVGGSQGSRAVNEALLGALEAVAAGQAERPAKLEIIWGTGEAHIHDIRPRLEALELGDWVHAVGYIEEMQQALAATDVALSRAGAMATAELAAWGVPMLLVPLPTAAADHQRHNARALAEAGAGVYLEEKTLSTEQLWNELVSLAGSDERRLRMAARARDRARPDAALQIAEQLLRLADAR